MDFSDEQLLAIVRGERARSIGFDLDPELTKDRLRALEYSKGIMADVPSLPNRSKAVSTDVIDAIETVMPDLLEIFVAGDDVVSFDAKTQADEAAAQQETDYIRQVIFSNNPGFLILYGMIKDALQLKTGIAKCWWENAPEVAPETFEGKTAFEVMLAEQDGEIINLRPSKAQDEPEAQPEGDGSEEPAGPPEPGDEPGPDGGEPAQPPAPTSEPLYDFELKKEGPDGRVRIDVIAPEDFTVSRDTVQLQDATYAAFRARSRAQTLIADGHDKAIIDRLPPYGIARDERVQLARDTAGEHLFPVGNDGPERDMRQVETVDHYVRILGDDDQIEFWRIYTGGDESILIDKEKLDRSPFGAITPFPVPHRFYGESIADKLLEIQRIKTALLRGGLDNIYFSLNQRYYVDMTKTESFTLSDLLDNRPGVPIRGRGPDAVTPLNNAAAGGDYFGAIEHISTMSEARTGIVRNAQGLNPDTLHDTMGGAVMLISEAQKRVRFIARIFAETGIKDLFLNVHGLIRKHASKAAVTKLRGQWVSIDPTQWAERNEMSIEIGAGGKGQMVGALTKIVGAQAELAKMPNGAGIVTPKNAYTALTDLAKASGLKTPEQYFTDPGNGPVQPPGPPPEAIKAQADAQAQQASHQVQLQIEQMKGQREKEALASNHLREMAKLAEQAKNDEADRKLDALKLAQEGELERLRIETQARTAITLQQMKDATSARSDATDLDIQRSESADAHLRAERDNAHKTGLAALDHLADHHAAEAAADRTAQTPTAEPE